MEEEEEEEEEQKEREKEGPEAEEEGKAGAEHVDARGDDHGVRVVLGLVGPLSFAWGAIVLVGIGYY